jgi:hypothetical protein
LRRNFVDLSQDESLGDGGSQLAEDVHHSVIASQSQEGWGGGLPIAWGGDHMLHLHRLENDKVVSGLHGVAVRDGELDHLPGHGGFDHRVIRGRGRRGAVGDDWDGEVAVS